MPRGREGGGGLPSKSDGDTCHLALGRKLQIATCSPSPWLTCSLKMAELREL